MLSQFYVKYHFYLRTFKIMSHLWQLKLDCRFNFKCWSLYTEILYIKLKGFCLCMCVFVAYTNSHFWTNLHQTLHTSSPWSGRDPRCLTFLFFVSSECRFHYRRLLSAQDSSATALHPWFLQVLVRRHGNNVVADDSWGFLLGVCYTLGNV